MIAIVDYGAGNLRSVAKALESLGQPCCVTADAATVLAADAVILPGVGAAAAAMASLRQLGMVEPLTRLIAADRPLFAVCLGMQLLFSASEEGGYHECLGVIDGVVRRLPPGLKVPHMGWNEVRQVAPHPVFDGIADEAHFYFVHSYFPEPRDRSLVVGETDYGVSFGSAIARGRLVATQFHPEKSGDAGLRMYQNFLRWAGVWR